MTHVVTVRPGRLRVSRDGLSVLSLRRAGASRDGVGVPGRHGRRSGRVRRPRTARSVPGRVGRPGTPMHPSRVALIRARGLAVRNGSKHVPGRSERLGTVAGVPGRLERPGTANERPGTVRASRDGRGRPGTLRLTSVPRRSWPVLRDGAGVLRQSGERPETAASPSVLGRQVVSQDGETVLLLGAGTVRGASWDGEVQRPGTA